MISHYAKYLWVSGQLTSPPPIIPYDEVVKGNSLSDWTEMDDMGKHEAIIETINNVSNENPALWELEM